MFSGKLCYVNLGEKERFVNYIPTKGELSHSPVSSFAENSEYLWVGTEGQGINQIDKKTRQFKYIVAGESAQNLSHNNIKTLAHDNFNRLWIGTYLGGLNCLNINTGKIKHYVTDNGGRGLLENSIKKLLVDGNDGLWIMYQLDKSVLSYFSFKDESFKHYYFKGSDNDTRFFDFCRDKNGIIWIISHAELFRLDPLENKTKTVVINNEKPIYLNAQSITSDTKGKLWIGTIDNGLYEYNTQTKEVKIHKTLLNFDASSISIFSMIFDDKENLWLGTDNGLFKYNTNKSSLMNFNEKDGLQGRIYYPIASFKDAEGRLFFGGTNGFTQINLFHIIPNPVKPKVTVSQFFINNEVYKEDNPSNKSVFADENTIKLDYTKNNFGFTFSSDSYLNPQKNRFYYRLKNYDLHFNEVEHESRTVFYSKVPPGNYTLEVYASNNDGIKSDKPLLIAIEIKPAPWFSIPAYIFYFLLALMILWWLIKEYKSKKEMQLQLYLDSLEKAKNQELYDSQLRFFTNISHDFRTPLFLMMASIEKIEIEGFKNYFHNILKRNTQRLLNLVNELMDFQSIENQLVELKVEPYHVNRNIKDVATDFMDYADKKEITFSYLLDEGLETDIYADKLILGKIVMNLLDNAFKYTLKGGAIKIETYKDWRDVRSSYANSHTMGKIIPNINYFSIVVRDTGIGISKESIAEVFDRYYKVKTISHSFHLGSGIGLALISSFVQLHKGQITIYSEREKGTDIIVCLPLDESLYSSDDFIQQETNEERGMLTANMEYLLDADQDVASKSRLDDDMQTYQKDIYSYLLRDNRSLLLVEDNDEVRGVIVDYLKKDFFLIEAKNGKEALEILDTKQVDIIVSDIMMPFIDGISLCQIVKTDINFSYIPFIMLTAKGGDNSKLEGVDAGADAYLEKPINLALLKITLQNFIKRQKQLKEYYAKNYFADTNANETNDNRISNEFLKKLIDVIDQNIENPELSVGFLTKELAMSRTKLYNKVKEMTNKSIVEFILSYRLRKAAKLIIETSLPMSEIMLKVGIENQPYFSRAFKKEFGETPTNFANNNKNTITQSHH